MSRTEVVVMYSWAHVMWDVYVDIMAKNLNHRNIKIMLSNSENTSLAGKDALLTRIITMNISVKLDLSYVPLIRRLERNVWRRMMNHRERAHL